MTMSRAVVDGKLLRELILHILRLAYILIINSINCKEWNKCCLHGANIIVLKGKVPI